MSIKIPHIPKVQLPEMAHIPPPEAVLPEKDMPEYVTSESVSREVLPTLLDLGEALFLSGADVNLIEVLLRNMGYSYGAYKMNVLVITASIIVTMTLPDGIEHTQTRRIESAGATDFYKLEMLTKLAYECIEAPLLPNELRKRFQKLKTRPFPRFPLYAGGVLSTASFAIFFGGTLLDGAVAALFSFVVCFMIDRFKPFTPNTIVFDFVASFVAGCLICAFTKIVSNVSTDMVIIGVLMLLIPGVAMTNATRDMISGDTISGVMRLVESLLWATALALGFMLPMWIFGMSASVIASNATPTVQLISAAPAALGFALFFDVRKGLIPVTVVGGVLTEGIYLICAASGLFDNVFVSTLIASMFAAVFSEILSQKVVCPTAVFYIVSVIPLVPGRPLYYTMQGFVLSDWSQAASFGFLTMQYALGIAIGIVVVWAVVVTMRNVRNWRQKRLANQGSQGNQGAQAEQDAKDMQAAQDAQAAQAAQEAQKAKAPQVARDTKNARKGSASSKEEAGANSKSS